MRHLSCWWQLAKSHKAESPTVSSQVCSILALRVASPPRIVYRNTTSHPSCAANIGQVWLMDRAEFNFWIVKKPALAPKVKLQLAPIKESLYIYITPRLETTLLFTSIIHIVDCGKCITRGVCYLFMNHDVKTRLFGAMKVWHFRQVFISFSTSFSSSSSSSSSSWGVSSYSVITVKKKVKVTLAQALRLCTGRTVHRGSRGIALPFLDHSTRRGWGVSVTPRPLFTPGERPGTHYTGG